MAKRMLECRGGCGSQLTVYAENVIAHVCRKCLVEPPRGSLLCETCSIRAVKVHESVKSVMCSHCTLSAAVGKRQEDRLDRAEITGAMIRLAMEKEGWKTYEIASAHLQKRQANMTPARLGRNVRGDISPPERSLVDWVREVLTADEREQVEALETPPAQAVRAVTVQEAEVSIVKWLKDREGVFSRAEIADDLGLTVSTWNQAIKSLVESGRVQRKGQKRGTRYWV